MIQIPDVSEYDPNYVMPAGTPGLIARCTLSTTVVDMKYPNFQAQASARGARFAGYHWLNHGNIQRQVEFAFAHSRGAPMMIDAEDVPGNTGYNGPLTTQDIAGFALGYRALGGACYVNYLPRWYWAGPMGAPSLSPLVSIGNALVSSNYSGSGGWIPYGGYTEVSQWQFTDKPIDMSWFRGTIDEWWAMFTGQPEETDVGSNFLVQVTGDPHVWVTNGFVRREVADSAEAKSVLVAQYGTPRQVSSVDVLGWVAGPVESTTPVTGFTSANVTLTGTVVPE